ncbi:MAG: DNA/RNA non-specific endonuclease [Bacteroidales bacterium]
MRLTGKQWTWLVILMILLVTVLLLTSEPWKQTSSALSVPLEPEPPPARILIQWNSLEMGYPSTNTTDTILSYKGFDLGYNEMNEQASWVVYVLTRKEVETVITERTDHFRPDTSIRSGSADLEDYRGSGYDRGHLAPAGDMRWSLPAMEESFLLSNMSPQQPGFNRGIWRRMEEQVRKWAVEKDSIYVITGPVLDPIRDMIGKNEVGVPGAYFKVLVDLSPPDFSMVAFLIPNRSSNLALSSFEMTVDSLEKLTGYDFFASAPDQGSIEWMERNLQLENWQ